jgi:ribosomal protein S16
MTDPVTLKIDEERIKLWLHKGARPSDTARDFLIGQGLLPKESAKKRPTRPRRETAQAKEPEAAATTGEAS